MGAFKSNCIHIAICAIIQLSVVAIIQLSVVVSMLKPRGQEHNDDDSSYSAGDASEASPDDSNIEGAIVTDQSISARKVAFYREPDRRIATLTPEQTSTHILIDESFA